ncbi:PspC domain-containing protein [Pseudonocardia kunmingensis]|uniref:Phage shock protein C (PspC) family protein n=1 Tax=Pseudonocardia kunmingensis TaxID=630975 RepID=A0A543E2A9_9PSEU|nr:phage shock protein C (PspC) family protein [Pseudonocardia kunmingensis]
METTTDSATTRLTKDPVDPTGPVFGPVPADEASGAPSYPASAAAPASRPKFRLRRSRTDRMLGGVCGGLAESLGVDAAVVRIGLVTLTVLGFGTGVVVYGAIWLLAPETDEP